MYQFRSSEELAEARSRPSLDRSYAIGLPVLAVILFVLSTHHGIGIWPDSTRYMNLSPQPWDAPLYPALLQLVAATGIDIATAAWGIGFVLTALNSFLTWHVLRVAGGRSHVAALGTLLIVIAPQSVSFYGLAMSEPLFLTAILASQIAFLRYTQTDDARWLFAVGIGVGLASLARFTGPALGAAFALFLLIDPRLVIAGRVANVGRILLPSALLFLGWAGLSEEISGRSTGRPLEWLGNMTTADWWSSFEALTAWIVPD
ncbi:MAG TPA: glycosyltransferase family 39 protein, partial [Sphingobium sp.]|nr:glycosyltransferase family 39 protein [Sphingobium sp.]